MSLPLRSKARAREKAEQEAKKKKDALLTRGESGMVRTSSETETSTTNATDLRTSANHHPLQATTRSTEDILSRSVSKRDFVVPNFSRISKENEGYPRRSNNIIAGGQSEIALQNFM